MGKRSHKPKALNLNKISPVDRLAIVTRFMSKTKDSIDGCVLWTGAKSPNGYGKFRVKNRVVPAHRVALAIKLGRVYYGYEAGHTCANRLCVAAAHLMQQKHYDNIAEMRERREALEAV